MEPSGTDAADAGPADPARDPGKPAQSSPEAAAATTDEPDAESPAAIAGDDETLAETGLELIDLAELAMPDVEIMIDPGSIQAQSRSVTLREDGRPVTVDFVRTGSLDEPLTLRLEEVGFSGNRSPWRSGQFEISNAGYVEFSADQARARITLTMASDSRREADQVSTLSVRETETAAFALARIELVLEDDDQRSFESSLPANTVAFAVSQVSVRERDPAVQIDLMRFNPDETRLVVATDVLEVTAARGEDFFPPGNGFVVFGAGQRSARLLIPLVQDAEAEGDEAFVVELKTESTTQEEGVYDRVAVIIRDDD